jgi:hypothetical protein
MIDGECKWVVEAVQMDSSIKALVKQLDKCRNKNKPKIQKNKRKNDKCYDKDTIFDILLFKFYN